MSNQFPTSQFSGGVEQATEVFLDEASVLAGCPRTGEPGVRYVGLRASRRTFSVFSRFRSNIWRPKSATIG
jgi:hypothetical protein